MFETFSYMVGCLSTHITGNLCQSIALKFSWLSFSFLLIITWPFWDVTSWPPGKLLMPRTVNLHTFGIHILTVCLFAQFLLGRSRWESVDDERILSLWDLVMRGNLAVCLPAWGMSFVGGHLEHIAPTREKLFPAHAANFPLSRVNTVLSQH